jgi:SAM-dependent methyltransferase
MNPLLQRLAPWAARLQGTGVKTRLLNPHEEWCDRQLGIRTFGFAPAVGEPDTPQWQGHYQPSQYRDLYKMLRHADVGAGDVYMDLGCGLGRTVFAADHLGASRSVGVDINPEMIAACRDNLARCNGPRGTIEFIEAPAETVPQDDTTVLFMFHPFGAGTLKTVIDVLGEAHRRRPRRLRIVYYNAVYDELLGASGFLTRSGHWPATKGGYPASFWTT